MTIDDIKAAWLRFIHRSNVTADLPTVETIALARILERLMYPPPAPTPEEAPRLWLHAGLVYLNELATDDEALGREQNMFEQAAIDWHFHHSRTARPSVAPPFTAPAGA